MKFLPLHWLIRDKVITNHRYFNFRASFHFRNTHQNARVKHASPFKQQRKSQIKARDQKKNTQSSKHTRAHINGAAQFSQEKPRVKRLIQSMHLGPPAERKRSSRGSPESEQIFGERFYYIGARYWDVRRRSRGERKTHITYGGGFFNSSARARLFFGFCSLRGACIGRFMRGFSSQRVKALAVVFFFIIIIIFF